MNRIKLRIYAHTFPILKSWDFIFSLRQIPCGDLSLFCTWESKKRLSLKSWAIVVDDVETYVEKFDPKKQPWITKIFPRDEVHQSFHEPMFEQLGLSKQLVLECYPNIDKICQYISGNVPSCNLAI